MLLNAKSFFQIWTGSLWASRVQNIEFLDLLIENCFFLRKHNLRPCIRVYLDVNFTGRRCRRSNVMFRDDRKNPLGSYFEARSEVKKLTRNLINQTNPKQSSTEEYRFKPPMRILLSTWVFWIFLSKYHHTMLYIELQCWIEGKSETVSHNWLKNLQ